jgi:hypothetical protein
MDSAHIMCRNGWWLHPKGHVARDLVTSAFRQLRVQRVKVLCRGTSRNPEPRNADSA